MVYKLTQFAQLSIVLMMYVCKYKIMVAQIHLCKTIIHSYREWGHNCNNHLLLDMASTFHCYILSVHSKIIILQLTGFNYILDHK